MQEIHHSEINLEHIKPKVYKRGLWFPLSVKKEYVEEDGLSFGHPIDSGTYWTVDFELAVGALAEDTVVQIAKLKDARKEVKINFHDFLEFKAVKNWEGDLEPLAEDLIWDRWPQEYRTKYNSVHFLDANQISQAEVLLKHRDHILYSFNGNLFASLGEHWNYGSVSSVEFANEHNLESMTEIVNSKKQLIKLHNERSDQVTANIKALETVFGYKSNDGQV